MSEFRPEFLQTVRNMRRLAEVPRWQIAPTIQVQTVQSHCVFVAYIYMYLLEEFGLKPTNDDFRRAIEHDEDEAIHGDTPSTSKQARDPKAVHNIRHVLLKVADYVEAVVFLEEERALGNQRVNRIINHVVTKQYTPWMNRALELTHNKLMFGAGASWLAHFLEEFSPERHPALEEL